MDQVFSEKIFEPDFVLDGPHLVEASAGTGKTYNIQNIYARLVVERSMRTSQIQVMTFTEAATKELRDRVRKVLAGFADFLEGKLEGMSAEEQSRFEKLRACARARHGGDVEAADGAARMNLRIALMEFDQAAISTIHGFCQRALSKFAFETRSAFGAELKDDKRIVLERMARDWWRSSRDTIPEEFRAGVSLDALNKYAAALSGKADWRIVDGGDDAKNYLLDIARGLVEKYESGRATRETQTFDDLLRALREALEGPRGGTLAHLLRGEFKAALVDEFQDTDPVQYAIFRRVFLEYGDDPVPALYFVGDPKQAIYSFRGGDIFVYKKAVSDPAVSDHAYWLDRNYRSTPRLIDAVNALFRDGGGLRTFGDDTIRYEADLLASDQPALKLPGGDDDPAPFRVLTTGKSDERNGAVVATVLETLADPVNQLSPKDIAILVTSHETGGKLRDLLHDVGVPAVLQKTGNVFSGKAAADFRQVLLAMAGIGGRGQVKAALGTSFFEVSEAQLNDEAFMADAVGMFAELNHVWTERGFEAVCAALDADERCNLRRRLAKLSDGERLLADVAQIVDLADAAIRELGPAPGALVDWVTERITASGKDGEEEDAEEYARHLESENDALKIMTIHASKGLAFPVVIVPYADQRPISAPYFYHDEDGCLQVGISEEAKSLAKVEAAAERTRLLYVAFTRAKQRTVLIASEPKPQSPLGRLLANARCNLEGSRNPPILWSDYVPSEEPPVPYVPPVKNADELQPAGIPPVYSREPVRGSYTSLAPDAHSASIDDHDVDAGGESAPEVGGDSAGEPDHPIFAIGGGARTGICWHEVLEKVSFDVDDEGLLAQVRSSMQVQGCASHDVERFDRESRMVAEMMKKTLEWPLTAIDGTAFSLRDIAGDQRMSEWQFDFSSIESSSTTETIAAVLREEWAGDETKRPFLAAMADWRRSIPKGSFVGFLDLVFRHGDAYYIVDWKSNWLHRRRSDFDGPGVRGEMARAGYFFQYVLYSVVLRKYLQETLGEDYSWERNFGGVRYYFLRGIAAEGAAPVFVDRPGERLLQRVSMALGLEER